MLRPALPAPLSTLARRPSLRSPVMLVVQLLVLTALLATTAAWSMTGKTVTLSVDGAPRQVDLRGDTVEDVLAAAGLEAGEHDLVVPSLEAPVEDGDRVALRRARELELVVDGERRTVWVTAASVDEALEQVGLREDGLAVSASRSRRIPLDGLTLDVRTPKAVTIRADGHDRALTTAAATVRDALIEADVHLRPADVLSHDRQAEVTEGLVITVQRVEVRRVTDEVSVPFETVRRQDADLTEGTTKVLTAGRTGLVVRTYEVTVTDGVETGRELVATERRREPVTRVLAVGTKPKPAAPSRSRSTGSADGLNWGALAQCESGGNPRAVSSTGKYRGLYQFSMATWRSVGGQGDPIDNSASEQTYRAKLLYQRAGRGQWPHCGKYL